TLAYTIQRYDFDHGIGSAVCTTSQAVTMAWDREVTRQTSVALRGGPRLTDGQVAPEFAASVSRRLKSAALSLAYARTVTTLIGVVGTAATQSLSADATFRPQRSIEVRVSPGVFQI